MPSFMFLYQLKPFPELLHVLMPGLQGNFQEYGMEVPQIVHHLYTEALCIYIHI